MFKQTIKQFFTSKTNYVAMFSIVSASVAYFGMQAISFETYMMYVEGGVLGITIKDAIAKK